LGSPDSQTVMQLFAPRVAIQHLEQSIADGREWYIALLEAIALWDCSEEAHNGRTYRYLIAGEALDWMLLAERLIEAVDSRLPEDEKLNFLFHGRFPVDITSRQFKQLIGSARYHQYLNYFYGVTVEEALFWAVQEEVRKERRVSGFAKEQDPTDEVYRRVYRQGREVLLKSFRKEKGYRHLKTTTLLEMKEFTYWLFKYRLKHSDKARIASDTKKALDWLSANGLSDPSLVRH
jgi:hypothetical protein